MRKRAIVVEMQKNRSRLLFVRDFSFRLDHFHKNKYDNFNNKIIWKKFQLNE